MATLIDTNILIDIATRDAEWHAWSRKRLAEARRRGGIIVNQIIVAEFALRYETLDDVDAALPPEQFLRENLPWTAAFAASRAFRAYRRAGGARQRILPDFFIGAHATIRGHAVLTRDATGFRSYFPALELISPETHP